MCGLVNYPATSIALSIAAPICQTVYVVEECYDRSTECKKKAFEGKCLTHSKHMKELCPYSCEYCQPALCVNSNPNCERWAASQACHIFPKLMAQKCKLACGYCTTKLEISVTQP